jgi:hypothetical protein
MSDPTEVLVPKERRQRIGGKEYVIKKLGLAQTIRLAGFAADLQQEVRAQILKAADSGANDLVAIMAALADTKAAELLQILLNAPSLEDRDRLSGISLQELSELAVNLSEVNDFDKIVRNFQKAAEKNKALLTLSTQPPSPSPASPPSSATA